MGDQDLVRVVRSWAALLCTVLRPGICPAPAGLVLDPDCRNFQSFASAVVVALLLYLGPIKMIGMVAPLLICGAILVFAPEELTPVAGADDAAGVAQLRDAGSDLGKVHKVSFFLFVPTESGAQWVAKRLESMGFRVVVSGSTGTDPQWHVLAMRQMLLDTSELVRIRHELTDLAGVPGGIYDGWETDVVR